MKVYQLQALYYLLENYNYFVEQEGEGVQYELVFQKDDHLVVGSLLPLTSFYAIMVEVMDINTVAKTIIVPKNDYRYYPNECFKEMVHLINRSPYGKSVITQSPVLFLEFLVSIVQSIKFNKKKHKVLLPYVKNPKFLDQPDISLSVLRLEKEEYPLIGLRVMETFI